MNINIKAALQKLVDKLEIIQKDEYTKNLHSSCFKFWKSELQEAKKVLEESDKPITITCDGTADWYKKGLTSKDVDLFDVKQLELFSKKLDPEAAKIIAENRWELYDDAPLKNEDEL